MESDSNTPPVINLEVTVPRIVFSSGLMEASTAGQQSESEEEEQVRLLPIGSKQGREQQPRITEVSTRMIHILRFRLFRLNVPAQEGPSLLQVLRRYKRRAQNTSQANHEQWSVSDVLAFSVEFRRLEGAVRDEVPLQPGLNRVVIYLDNEGMPTSYSIDGAES